MSAKRSRTLRAGLEGLERRNTPSTHASASATVVNIHSSGHATVALSQPGENGQFVETRIAGTNATLGAYTASLDIYYGPKASVGIGTGTITAADGDTITLDLLARANIPSLAVSHGRTGVIKLSVSGGTGELADVTGRGELVGNVNYSYDFPYKLIGRIEV